MSKEQLSPEQTEIAAKAIMCRLILDMGDWGSDIVGMTLNYVAEGNFTWEQALTFLHTNFEEKDD